MKKNGVSLRCYLLPDSGVHEASEVARVGGSDHDIVIRVLVQDGGLGGEGDVGVEGLVGGGGLCPCLQASAQKLAASRMTSVVMGR